MAFVHFLGMNPEILLCDGISPAPNPERAGEVLQVIESLAKVGMTIIMVTHEMNFAHKVGGRVAFVRA